MRARQEEVPEHLNGTGGIERSVGTVVGHRPQARAAGGADPTGMKWRGMGWTKTRAANMLRLRLKTLGLQD